jgi:hypothetical protein
MRAIDADEVINKLTETQYVVKQEGDVFHHGVSEGLNYAMTVIGKTPTLNTVRNGKWLGMQRCNMDGDLTYRANCSVCGVEVVLWEHNSFCPCCGAKMEV